ncbi:hypothetical protein LCGC14_2123570 [marine sediment metagenome]|uniref:Uncharacterized protein n=1 Tax=marine sediment metagenome TaxID=412755 RepID=A0A0F9E3H1_9ZZZZ
MKLFGLIVGCPEELFHCEHIVKNRKREAEVPISEGCRRTYTKLLRECFVECCKCDWSVWVKDPTEYWGDLDWRETV